MATRDEAEIRMGRCHIRTKWRSLVLPYNSCVVCVCVCARVKACLARGHLRYFEGGGGGGGCCSKSECIWCLGYQFCKFEIQMVGASNVGSLCLRGGGGVHIGGCQRKWARKTLPSPSIQFKKGVLCTAKKSFFFFGGTQHPLVQAIGFRLLAPHGGR